MNAKTYNASIFAGLSLIGGGMAQWSIPLAMSVVGSLVIALTLFGAFISSRKGAK